MRKPNSHACLVCGCAVSKLLTLSCGVVHQSEGGGSRERCAHLEILLRLRLGDELSDEDVCTTAQFLSHLLEPNPNNRLSPKDALNHPWLS